MACDITKEEKIKEVMSALGISRDLALEHINIYLNLIIPK